MYERSKYIIVFSLIGTLTIVIVFVVLSALQTSPDYEYLYLLGSIRDCVWLGFEEYNILYDQKKTDIVLPKSLLELTPLALRVELKEHETQVDNYKLIYNPTGYENRTWIAIYVTEGIEGKLLGDYVLWYDKEIKRDRNVLEAALTMDHVKYYYIRKIPNVAD